LAILIVFLVSLSSLPIVTSTMPGDNGKIAFASDRDGNFEIYTMTADGFLQTRLTNNNAKDDFPSWSPDGTKIAFTSDRDNGVNIYVMNANGSSQTRLTITPNAYHPTWSPDGTKIAFASDRDGNYEIYVMNTDGSSQTRLTNNNAKDDFPSWSSDGTKITFASDRDGNLEIYVMNSDGFLQTRLTNNNVIDTSPSWSPDGTKIAFARSGFGMPAPTEIWVMGFDGSSQTRLTNIGLNDYPSWSPDGTKIVFASNPASNWDIYVMNTIGSQLTRLTGSSNVDTTPSWQSLPSSMTNFKQSGIDLDFKGSILNIDEVYSYTVSQLPFGWPWVPYVKSHTFSWISPLTVSAEKRYVWYSTTGELSVFQSGTITPPTGIWSVIGNYMTQYNINISTGSGGTVDKVSGWYNVSIPTSITATPSTGYTFKNWVTTGGVSVSNTSSSATTMTVTAAGILQAKFELILPIGVSFIASGVGGDFTGTVLVVDGAPVNPADFIKSYSWSVSSTHSFAWQSPLAVSSEKRYVWLNTSGLSALQSGSVTTPSGSSSVTGTYSTEYYVTVQTPIGGTINFATSGWYRSDQAPSISATASTNYLFKNWITTGGVTIANPTASSTTFIANGPGTITANFSSTLPAVNVTVTIQSPDHGTTNPAPGTYTVQQGSQMTITAIPASSYEWYWWDGLTAGETVHNPLTITANQNRSITAVFRLSTAPSGIEPGIIVILVGVVAIGIVLYLLINRPTSITKFKP
jgi:Tol biopolymer transport system component